MKCRRLLIANRGEIACRIVRTARRLGITSIAIYSEADRAARHVRVADEAYFLGAAPAADSYLDFARVVALAVRVGADSVHPGYGFLSENASFAQACAEAGLTFVGPPAAAIRAMGSKSASKASMAAVGVPVAPGYHEADQSLQRLCSEADRVGYPLIIKASAGGGGKGMQVVQASAQLPAALESARRLARAAFGDDRLLLERYFPGARHVEVQVFADIHGNVVSLFDRDCSVQRRHQKIIEEAPAPGLRAEVRAAMADAAIRATRTVQYVGAGTIEFLVDAAQEFYFMEMNTRLQVEHPVTECITGIDLVEWQIRVARDEALPLGADAITHSGVAIEARLYAEDPARDYLPSVGRISHLVWPREVHGVRVDAGVDAGDEVSSFYDPMLGKLVAWAGTRQAAVELLLGALRELEIIGVVTNRALLASVLGDAAFRDGDIATDFLPRRHAELIFEDPAPQPDDVVCAALWCATRMTAPDALWLDTQGWRLGARPLTSWLLGAQTVAIEACGAGAYVRLEGREQSAQVISRSADFMLVELGGTMRRVRIVEVEGTLHLFGPMTQVSLQSVGTDQSLQATGETKEGSLVTPLPGTVVAVHVATGDAVSRGAALITVEAMKMEHTLTAPYDGVVGRLSFGLGDRVSAGAVLAELTPAG